MSAQPEPFAATSLPTLVQMVGSGLGVTFLPMMAVSAGLANAANITVRPIDADRDHREFKAGDEAQHLGDAGDDRVDRHADLLRAVDPAEFGGTEQQHHVEQRQQQHRIGDIMFEQADHGGPTLSRECKQIRHRTPCRRN